jgi:hypothetical protein
MDGHRARIRAGGRIDFVVLEFVSIDRAPAPMSLYGRRTPR